MPTLSGTVLRAPVVNERVIYTTIAVDDFAYQLVCFRQYRPAALANAVMRLNVGDHVTAFGKIENNPRTHERQLILNGLTQNEQESGSDEGAISFDDSKTVEIPDEF